MKLRESKHIEGYSLENILTLAENSIDSDNDYLRTDFVSLLKTSKYLLEPKEL
jgi:hypothetical protein